MNKKIQLISTLFIFFVSIQFLSGQTIRKEELHKNLKGHSSINKEVAYLHLNKSYLFQGEQLGFSAYIVNKRDLKPSVYTSNLYVQIKNSAEAVIHEELLLVENGLASGVINITSAFVPGDYTITAFTNWMRNFEEQNYFTEKIKVLATSYDNVASSIDAPGKIDVQFLPESGHLLNGIINTVGVVARGENGYGLSGATVLVRDSKDKTVGNITLNEVGIGKFTFIPDEDESYEAVATYGGKDYEIPMNTKIEKKGIILSSTRRGTNLDLMVHTIPTDLINLQGRKFVLIIQGRASIEAYSFMFEDKNTIPFHMDLDKMDPGMNIVTLFDQANRPVAERMFFNYHRLPIEGIREPTVVNQKDSLQFNVSFNEKTTRALSVSVLPKNSVSYKRNHNIHSYNLLQPYVRGVIENAGWYFKDISNRKKEELDNLLLTQGWSSYNWENIFQDKKPFEHKFERNFELKARLNKSKLASKDLRYMVHANSHSPILYLDVPKDNHEFILERFIPIEGEKVTMSRVKSNADLVPAEVYVQTSPNHIPDFRPKHESLIQKPQVSEVKGKFLLPAFEGDFTKDTEDLGEVLITARIDKVKERERELNNHSWGNVSVITETEVASFQTLANFLASKNLSVSEGAGTFSVSSFLSDVSSGFKNAGLTVEGESQPKPEEDASQGIAIYLDDMLIMDKSMFYRYSLATIDYIEINKTGMGAGLMGSNGSIRIYSDFRMKKTDNRDRNRIQEIDIPLAYSSKKEYYTPEYDNTYDSFFQQYGVIDWKANLHSANGEDIKFTIKKPDVDYDIIVEGFTTDGTLIHEVRTFSAQ